MTWRKLLRLAPCAALLLVAQPAIPAEFDNLAATLALPVAGGLTGARDTARFAWVENAAGVRNIWLATPGQPARRITDYKEDDGQQLYDLTLSRDGTSIAFVRGGDDEFPDGAVPNPALAATAPRQQIFLMPVTAPAPVLVDDGHSPVFDPSGARLAYTRKGEIWLYEHGTPRRLATVAGEVTWLQWSPDGTHLLFVDDRDNHSFIALLEVADARLTYIDSGLGLSVEPQFSPNGRQVAFIRFVNPPAGAASDSGRYWSIRLADVAGGNSRIVWAAPEGRGGRYAGTRGRNLFWSADGELVFPWERSGWLHAYAIGAATGEAPRELTPGTFEVEAFLLGSDGRSLVYTANAGDLERRHVWRRPLKSGAPEQVTKGEGSESYPTLGGGTIAVLATDVTHPAYPAQLAPGLSPLGRVATGSGFIKPETIVFRAEDGVEVHGQLFRARGPGKHPALVFAHGGPRRQMLPGFHPSIYYSNAYILNQHFATQGYDVLSVNYRGGTGYGLAFRDAPDTGREGAAEYRDILAAGHWLAARADVDPARIGIWGGSWGGYLTALALARDSALFAAGVDFHGVHAMVRPVEKTLSPEAEAAAHQMQWVSSPIAAIDRWRSPVLLIHGDEDRNVDFSQSLLLARMLTARGVPYRELVLPNEGHAFFRYADWLSSYRAADAFFDEMLVKRGSPR